MQFNYSQTTPPMSQEEEVSRVTPLITPFTSQLYQDVNKEVNNDARYEGADYSYCKAAKLNRRMIKPH